MARHQVPPPRKKSRQRLIVGALLGIVVLGGAVSFVLFGGGEKEEKEEIVIVDLSLPPPPPPPPPPAPPEEENLAEPEPSEVSEDIAEADAPEEMSDDSTADMDMGMDLGDLASGGSGTFTVSAPRVGRRGSGGGGGGDSLMGGDVDSPPTPVSKIQPSIPSSLQSKGIGGKVLIACVVDESGKVVSTSIKQSSGHPDLDKAAASAVSRWKFKPATKAGRNVRANCLVPYNFEVKKK
jgi:protein TonB